MLKELKQRYETTLFDSVMPFWLDHPLGKEHGGYFTCLDRTARSITPVSASGFRGGRFGR